MIFFAPRCDVDPPPARRVDVLRAAAGCFLGGAVRFGADAFLAVARPAAFLAEVALLAVDCVFFAVLVFFPAVAERVDVALAVDFDAVARLPGAAFFAADFAVDLLALDRLVLFPADFFVVALLLVDLFAFAGFFAAAFFAVVFFAVVFFAAGLAADFAVDLGDDLVADLLVADLRAEDALRDTEADFVAPAVRAAWVPRAAEVK